MTQIQVNNLVDAIRSGLVSSCVPTQDFASACNVADAIVYVSLSMDKIAKSIDNLADAIRESKN